MSLQPFIQRGRITSLFGTYLPPKRKQKALKHLTITFIVKGTIPSKKNMIWADSNIHLMKGKLYKFRKVQECVDYLLQHFKIFVRNSKKYVDWRDEQKPIIQEQARTWHEKYRRFGFQYPLNNVSISVYHYWGDNMERDLTNKLDSITDLLVDSGIIVNDNWQHLRKIHSEAENYKDQVLESITRIDVTQSYFD